MPQRDTARHSEGVARARRTEPSTAVAQLSADSGATVCTKLNANSFWSSSISLLNLNQDVAASCISLAAGKSCGFGVALATDSTHVFRASMAALLACFTPSMN